MQTGQNKETQGDETRHERTRWGETTGWDERRRDKRRRDEKWDGTEPNRTDESGWPSTSSAQPKGLNPLSQVGQDGTKGGCHMDLGIFRSVLLLCFRPLWVRQHKGEVCQRTGLSSINPSDHPAARHPAQPSLNRRLRWEVEDWVWTDRRAGKRETEASREEVEVEWMEEQTVNRGKVWLGESMRKG